MGNVPSFVENSEAVAATGEPTCPWLAEQVVSLEGEVPGAAALGLKLDAGCQPKASLVEKGLKSEAKATIRELLAPQLKLSDMRKLMLFVQDSVWKNVAAALHLTGLPPR
jgi:hypothetical protein